MAVLGLWLSTAMPMLRSFAGSIGLARVVSPITRTQEAQGIGSGLFVAQNTPDIKSLVATQISEYRPKEEPTAYPTYTLYPTPTMQDNPKISYMVKGIYSYYWPPLGGINCDKNPDGSEECEYMASGLRVDQWIGKAFACPVSLPFFTKIHIVQLGIDGICLDRGEAIVIDKYGSYWFDHLISSPLIGWSSPVDVIIYPQ